MVFPDKLDQLDQCDPDYDYDCGMYEYKFKIRSS